MSELSALAGSEGCGACGDDVERADTHPVSIHPYSICLRSLPGGHRLLDRFKHIHTCKASFPGMYIVVWATKRHLTFKIRCLSFV